MTNAATGHALHGRNTGWRKAVRFALTENPVLDRAERGGEVFRLVAGSKQANGAHSQGETLEELNDNLREVTALVLEDGEPEMDGEYVGTQTVMVDVPAVAGATLANVQRGADVLRQSDYGVGSGVGVHALVGKAGLRQMHVAIVALRSRHDVHGAPPPELLEVAIGRMPRTTSTTKMLPRRSAL